ncbi:hypothetical protein G7Z17_g5361 [Cylindrodendrum hubeiense]|uniref:NAD-dependent epimerase/dehydratase domain-containing protein n=1 Tax=Cylindrodendrum hubeiense TaxID=595255 RepID=A0A9P5HC74_9HYPO|nr:hypothetical protein G7Z17_g5361 [Cylindrodendrum hubeiense]
MSKQTVLVTGANGYVALHVIHQCLAKGWSVIGTVRSEKAANRVRSIFPDAVTISQLDIVMVADIVQPESFIPAFNGRSTVTAVINTASPLINNPKDVRYDVLDPAIRSATAILEAVVKFGGEFVRRVVHTSSCAAVLNPALGDAPGKTYTPEDYNPTTYKAAATGGHALAYMGSKALSERAMWAWVDDHKPLPFDVVSVAPAGLFGPHYLGALESKETIDLLNLNLSSQMLWALAEPTATPTPFNSYHLGCWADVRDAAAALVAAVATPTAGGQRFICANRCHWQLVRDAARRAVPELADRIDLGVPGSAEEARDTTYDIDGSKITEILGVQYTSLEESLGDSFAQLLEAERRMR